MTVQRMALGFVLVLGSLSAVEGQVPTFAVKTEEVRVDVLVTDHGKPARGLRAEDFEVFDNGKPQKITFAGQDHIPFNAILVLDMSSSVAGERLRNLRSASEVLLGELREDERAGLVTFSHIVTVASGLTKDIGLLKTRLEDIEPFGDTAIIDASYAGLILAEEHPGRPLVIVFSDGLDTSSWLTGSAVLDVAKHSDAVVYAVSSGRHPKMTFLQDLTQLTGGALFKIESTRNLDRLFLEILEEFRQRYLLSYSPSGTPASGWHSLEVRVRKPGLDVKARPGFVVH